MADMQAVAKRMEVVAAKMAALKAQIAQRLP